MKPKAFSLVELLVATAIMTFVAIILLTVTSGVMRLWQGGMAHNDRRASTIYAFQRIARDLRHASVNINPLKPSFFSINPVDLSPEYALRDSVFFRKGSELIGYFVRWVDGRPILCRLVSEFQEDDPRNDKISTSMRDMGAKSSGYDGLLAENVLALFIEATDANGQVIYDYPGANGDVISNRVPIKARIAIVVIDQRTAVNLDDVQAERPGPQRTGNFLLDAQTFVNQLPPKVRRGARIETTIISPNCGPKNIL